MSILIFSKMFFYPLNIQTRFSAGVIALHFILLIEGDNLYKKIIPWSAILIFVERTLYFNFFTGSSFLESVLRAYPVLFYYLTYMTLLYLSKFSKRSILQKLGLLLLADTTANVIELIIRDELSLLSIDYTFIASIIRILASSVIYLIYRYRIMIITGEIHQEKYISLNKLVSSLEAELFYLKKSNIDIESVMKRAHSLHTNEDIPNSIRIQFLDIARDVHEIKKDYLRITKGIENNLSTFREGNTLPLEKVGEIISQNTKNYILSTGKDVNFSIDISTRLVLNNYHKIFIIINNLLENAIDAIDEKGVLELNISRLNDNLSITVIDNGKGISDKNQCILFNPGFTTKYNKITGEMNTGLGLSHVKNIIESLSGSITLKSTRGLGTTFYIELPIEKL